MSNLFWSLRGWKLHPSTSFREPEVYKYNDDKNNDDNNNNDKKNNDKYNNNDNKNIIKITKEVLIWDITKIFIAAYRFREIVDPQSNMIQGRNVDLEYP